MLSVVVLGTPWYYNINNGKVETEACATLYPKIAYAHREGHTASVP